MSILGHLEAASLEKLNMERHGRNPLVTSYNMSRSHKMVVNGMCEMIGRNSVRLEKNNVLYILGHFNLALYHVVKLDSVICLSGGAKSQSIGAASLDFLLLLFKSEVAALCPFAEVALNIRSGFFLLGTDSV